MLQHVVRARSVHWRTPHGSGDERHHPFLLGAAVGLLEAFAGFTHALTGASNMGRYFSIHMASWDKACRSWHVHRALFSRTHYPLVHTFANLHKAARVGPSLRGKGGNWRKAARISLSAVYSISIHRLLMTHHCNYVAKCDISPGLR